MWVNRARKCINHLWGHETEGNLSLVTQLKRGQVCVYVAVTGSETGEQGKILPGNWGSTSTTWVCWMPWWFLQEFLTPHRKISRGCWSCSCWTLFSLLPNLSYVTSPSIVEYVLLNLHLFLCCVVLLSLPGVCTAVSKLWPVLPSVPLPYQQLESQLQPPLQTCLLFRNCFDRASTELLNKEL